MCGPADVTGAYMLDQTVQDTCCADVDGSGTLRLADCTRQVMMVYQSDTGSWQTAYGPGYDAHNVGVPCN